MMDTDILSTPCCDVWTQIMGRFDWMHYEKNPRIVTMPHIKSGDRLFFVNHCPSCGADVRNYNAPEDEVEASKAMTGDLLL
jgi:hypothetical protein